MKAAFKFHGVIKDCFIFTITLIGPTNHQLHYKMDDSFHVKRIDFDHPDMVTCHTTEYRGNGCVVPARADVVTHEQSKALLGLLIGKKVNVKPMGSLSGIDFQIIQNYAFKIVYPHGTTYKYYDGVNEAEALSKAKLNNPKGEADFFKGNMAGRGSV